MYSTNSSENVRLYIKFKTRGRLQIAGGARYLGVIPPFETSIIYFAYSRTRFSTKMRTLFAVSTAHILDSLATLSRVTVLLFCTANMKV